MFTRGGGQHLQGGSWESTPDIKFMVAKSTQSNHDPRDKDTALGMVSTWVGSLLLRGAVASAWCLSAGRGPCYPLVQNIRCLLC